MSRVSSVSNMASVSTGKEEASFVVESPTSSGGSCGKQPVKTVVIRKPDTKVEQRPNIDNNRITPPNEIYIS